MMFFFSQGHKQFKTAGGGGRVCRKGDSKTSNEKTANSLPLPPPLNPRPTTKLIPNRITSRFLLIAHIIYSFVRQIKRDDDKYVLKKTPNKQLIPL